MPSDLIRGWVAGCVELRGVRVGVCFIAGRRGFGRTGAARQRKILALIERADAALVEAGFIDLQVGAVQRIRRQFLDRELHRGGRGVEAAIREARPLLLADRGGEQFGGSVVAEGSHGQGPLIFLVRTRSKSRTDRTGRPKRRRAGTRHFRTALNISSFERNATPDGPDDESGHAGAKPGINPDISISCVPQSLPSSSRMISTIRMTPPRPMPE